MGGNSSKSSVEQTREFITNVTNDVLISNTTKVSASNINTNILDFAGATFKYCNDMNFTQKINAATASSGELTTTVTNELTKQLTDKLSAEIDNQASQKTGFLSAAMANSSEARSSLKEKVVKNIESTFKSENYTEIVSKSQNSNIFKGGKMNIECGPSGGKLVFDQNILSNVTASLVADLVTKNLESLISENTSDTKVTQKSDQQNQGLNDLVDSVFNGIAKIFSGWVGIVIVAILLCVSLASSSFAAMKMKGGGDAASASFPYQMPSKV